MVAASAAAHPLLVDAPAGTAFPAGGTLAFRDEAADEV